MTGLTSHHAGQSAELSVELLYTRRGLMLAARRWKGTSGEIDLIFRDGAAVILVEVKKSRSFDAAKLHLTRAQYRRIWATAQEFLASEPNGLGTDIRLDLALVDGTGRIEVIENVTFD
jgi:putative endonuclease